MLFNRIAAVAIQPISIVSAFLFCIISFFYLDLPLAVYLYHLDLENSAPILSWLTSFGLGMVYLTLFIIAGLLFRFHLKNRVWEARMWFLATCVTLSAGICVILKILLGRARPIMWFDFHQWGFYGLQSKSVYWSLPSGHTTNIMAVVLGLSIIFPLHARALLGAGLLIAFSRVLLTFHYLSDVVSAVYLTLLEISLLCLYLKKKGWLLPAISSDKPIV